MSAYPPYTFANQGNFLLLPPPGVTTPASELDANFAATAPRVNAAGYPTGSTLGNDLAAAAFLNGVASSALLAAKPGSSLIGYSQGGTGAQLRTNQDRLRERVSVKDFGALGDGTTHALSERYATLAAAQADYPFVTALTQSIDWAAAQAAANYVAFSIANSRAGAFYFPYGDYLLSDSIKIASFVTCEGVSRTGSVLRGAAGVPVFVGADVSSLASATIRNLKISGGTYAIYISGQGEDIVLEKLIAINQTVAQFGFDNLESSVIRDCNLDTGVNGIVCTNAVFNSILIENVRSTAHSGPYLKLVSGDGVMVVGGSMEGGSTGLAGVATIDAGTTIGLTFDGVYFETIHEKLIKTAGAKNIAFRNCIVNGALPGDQPVQFDVGSDLIVFDNTAFYGTNGLTFAPVNVCTIGTNANLSTDKSNVWSGPSSATGRVKLLPRLGTATTFSTNLLTFTRPSASSASANISGIFGRLRIRLDGDTGGNPRSLATEYVVGVDAFNGFPVSINVNPITGGSIDSSGGAFSFTLSTSGATTLAATLHLNVAGLQGSVEAVVSASFEWDSQAYIAGNELLVTAP